MTLNDQPERGRDAEDGPYGRIGKRKLLIIRVDFYPAHPGCGDFLEMRRRIPIRRMQRRERHNHAPGPFAQFAVADRDCRTEYNAVLRRLRRHWTHYGAIYTRIFHVIELIVQCSVGRRLECVSCAVNEGG
jgi:hypothetical protein